MKLIEGKETEYSDWRKKNEDDAYGLRIFTYAEQWADLMEKRLADGETIAQCARETSREADTDGITGFMYGAAVSVLSKEWVHGEELRRWHNLDVQLGKEGEEANRSGGTLNPALMKISY